MDTVAVVMGLSIEVGSFSEVDVSTMCTILFSYKVAQ